ncbi:MAG TPA: PilC/PilY family type IV pilus protein [Smithellaceae bacterium]|nr:PilC/PilY family type IV pilus protein [Smithellaceae bacterium]
MKTQRLVLLMMALAFLVFLGRAGNATAPAAGEESLFVSSTQPDALLLLDLSGSMLWNPSGDDLTYGSTTACYPDAANCSGTGCSGGYCGSSKAAVTYYAASACGTADTVNCAGSDCANGFCSSSKVAKTYYASNTAGTADLKNCRGTNCGRSDGYCNSSLAGGFTYYAHDATCTPNFDQCKYSESWKDCKDGFCASPHQSWKSGRYCQTACTTAPCNVAFTTGSCSMACVSGGCDKKCSRLNIAKRSAFNILDDNADGSITTADEGSLGVRLGYMRYYDCSDDDTGNSYTSGCNSLIRAIGSKYSLIYCANSTSCSATSGSGSASCVNGESASGGTPLATAMKEAKLYLDAHKAADAAKACRAKFVIFITDGSDTYACNGDGSECDPHRYKNRRESVAKAKALYDAGYKIFVIGFGAAMPPYLRNTLNWMAYYGGTDNPNEANAGSTSGYGLPTAKDCSTTTPADTSKCCNLTAAACYPSGVSSCANDASTVTAACYDSSNPYPGTAGNSTANFKASANDPGYADLSGYAFLAGDADQLVAAVKAAINIIREATYSFSQASIQSSRTTDENFVYEGSFQPVANDPFWLGHLRKYQINANGTVGNLLLDAGEVLQATDYSTRIIKTCIGCTTALTDFSTSISPTYFGLAVTETAQRDAIVGYVQGNPAYNPDNWKLGDVFRSTPITVGTPSMFFEDYRDTSSNSVTCSDGNTQTLNAYAAHRCTHVRSSANGKRLIVAGANDGQFHAFRTSNMTEAWSFVPPNLLSKLKNIAHATDPSTLVHQYFVDGPVSGADVWLGSGDGISKYASDWRTILVFGEGRGSTDRLWSSSSSCDSGLAATYSATYSNYCGIYALDVTNSLSPLLKWRMNTFDATTQAPYIGESWSKMVMGRIRTKSGGTETEKWVGFIGGGYNANDYKKSGDDTRGKGFFVVDLNNGRILWSFTLGGATSSTGSTSMKYSLPAPPAIVDTDNDGFVDTAYLGDLGGNMWRFKFCTKAMTNNGCSTSDWTGGMFFDSSTGSIRPIYTGAAVAKDASGNLWVFWGTGDKVDPTASNAQEHFYAVKDNRTSKYSVSDIDNITQESQTYDPNSTTDVGYRIQLPGSGQKILAEPTIFGGVAYFTSFTPGNPNDPCVQAGEATLNGVKFNTGEGIFSSTSGGKTRQMAIGSGIASAPIVSLKPSGTGGGTDSIADLYVTVSGGGLSQASTQKVDFNPPGVSNMTNMIYWKDRRIE